jgi:hypothetical protein
MQLAVGNVEFAGYLKDRLVRDYIEYMARLKGNHSEKAKLVLNSIEEFPDREVL